MERVLLSLTTVCGFSGKSFNRRPTLTTLNDRLLAVLFLVGVEFFRGIQNHGNSDERGSAWRLAINSACSLMSTWLI
jgi:hypothetical protein